jgi:hypothetical protein
MVNTIKAAILGIGNVALLAACNLSTIVTPPPSYSVKNDTFSIVYQSCTAIQSVTSNVSCLFKVENLKNSSQNLTLSRTNFEIQNPDNSKYGVDNLAFSGNSINTSTSASFVPKGSLDLEVKLTVPGGTSQISIMNLGVGYPYYLEGSLKKLPIEGVPENFNPPTALTNGIYNLTTSNLKVRFRECVPVTRLTSNLQCKFTFASLEDVSRNLGLGKGNFSFTTTTGTRLENDYISFDAITFDTSLNTVIAPNGSTDVFVNFTVPKTTTQVAVMDLGVGYPYYLTGALKNLPITGTPEDFNPPTALPNGIYNLTTNDLKIRFRECLPVDRLASNLQCRFTFANMKTASRNIGLSAGNFSFTSTSGTIIENDDVSFDSTTFNTSLNTTLAPNGSVDAYIDFNVPSGTTKLIQLNFGAGYPYYLDGQFREIPVSGAVANPLPTNTLPGGMYWFTSDARRVKIDICNIIIAGTNNVTCKIRIINLRNEVINIGFNATNFFGTLPSGQQFTGNEIRFGTSSFAANTSGTLAPNGYIDLEVRFTVPNGTAKLSELKIGVGYPYYLSGTTKEIPLVP